MIAADDDLVHLHLGGAAYHVRLPADASGLVTCGTYGNRRLVRAPNNGENRLVEWCREHDWAGGDVAESSELDDDYQYGLRVPGVRQVHRIAERPNDSLSSIAEQFGPFDE